MTNVDAPETSVSPTEELAAILHDDMSAVNSIMLDRMQSEIPLIPELAEYLIAAGGKRIRPLLTLACAELCDDHTDNPKKMAAAVEFVHTATLLHDDVIDGSDLRRGKPVASEIFGNQASVLVGDFLFARASELVVETGSIAALATLSRAARVITEGEVLQMSMAGDVKVTRNKYFKVIGAKAAALFAAATEAVPSLNGLDPKPLADYGYNLGMAFQIVDDVMDYTSTGMGKDKGDDFVNGKITLPVIIASERASSAEREFIQDSILHPSVDKLEDFVMALTKQNGFEESIRIAAMYCENAVNSLSVYSGRIADNLMYLPHSVLKRTA